MRSVMLMRCGVALASVACLTLVLSALVSAQAGTASSEQRVQLAAPRTVCSIDSKMLDGEPMMLAWSPDQSQLYVESVQHTRMGWPSTTRHFIVNVGSGTVGRVDVQPDWADAYWGWKSGRRSPADPTLMLDVDTQMEAKQSVNTPTGGDLARGGTQATNEAASWVANHQVVRIAALKLRGATIGEWRNEVMTPGSNFTWAPAPYHLLAYARRNGGPLIVVNEEGHSQALTGATAAILPAWSNSGHELAWLERRSKSQFDVMVASVTTR